MIHDMNLSLNPKAPKAPNRLHISILIAGFGLLAAAVGLWLRAGPTSIDLKSPQDTAKLESALGRSVVSVVSQLTPHVQAELVQYGGWQEDQLTKELTHCSGLLVAPDAVVLPKRCLMRPDNLGLLTNRTIKWAGAGGGVGSGKAVYESMKQILGIDVSLDLIFVQIEPISGTKPVMLEKAEPTSAESPRLIAATLQPEETQTNPTSTSMFKLSQAYLSTDATEKTEAFIPIHWAEGSFVPGATFWDLSGRLAGLATYGWSATHSRTLTLAVSQQALAQAVMRFVANRGTKEVTVTSKEITSSNPLAMVQGLGLKTAVTFAHVVAKDFEKMSVNVGLPISPQEFNRQVIPKTEEQVIKILTTPSNHAATQPNKMFSWQEVAKNRGSSLYATTLDYNQLKILSDDAGSTPLVTTTLMTPPEFGQTTPNLLATYRYKVPTSGRPRKPGDMADQPEDQALPQDDTRSSEPADVPRYANLFQSKPLITVLLRHSKNQGTDPYTVTTSELLASVTGDAGLLVHADLRHVQVAFQKELLIKKIETQVDFRESHDGLGRTWRYHGFTLMGALEFDSWCGALPRGALCLTRLSSVRSPELREAFLKNTERFVLPNYLVEPAFWPISSLLQFQTDGRMKEDPLMAGFQLTQGSKDKLEVVFPEHRIKVTHDALAGNAHLRLTGALRPGQGAKVPPSQVPWTPSAYEIYSSSQNSEPQMCQVGLVQANTPYPPGSALQTVTAASGQLQVYSYCVALEVLQGSPSVIRSKGKLAQSVQPYPIHVASF